MNSAARTALAIAGVGTSVVGLSLATAGPASAGGIGDFLSPAFGTNCANHNSRPHATGTTTAGTGSLDGNLLGIPAGSALNQCGGADAPSTGNMRTTVEIFSIGANKVVDTIVEQ